MTSTTRPSPRQQEILLLRETLQLEQDTWELYHSAGERLAGGEIAEGLLDFANDHHLHLISLRTRLALLGVSLTPTTASLRVRGVRLRWMTRFEAEASVLATLAARERRVLDHYRSIDLSVLGRGARALVHHAHCDEKGHHNWLEDRVARLPRRPSLLPVHVMARASASHWAHARS